MRRLRVETPSRVEPPDLPWWHEQAGCRTADPVLFFPEKGKPTRPAKAICAECPVRAECLDYALERDEAYGIWGGMTYPERRQERRRRGLTGSRPHRQQDPKDLQVREAVTPADRCPEHGTRAVPGCDGCRRYGLARAAVYRYRNRDLIAARRRERQARLQTQEDPGGSSPPGVLLPVPDDVTARGSP